MNPTDLHTSNRIGQLEKVPYRVANELNRFDNKRSVAFTDDSEGKYCENCSKIPRRQMPASLIKETLKSLQAKGKTKKPTSMIPRSNSRTRHEIEKFKFELFSQLGASKGEQNESSGPSESFVQEPDFDEFSENEKKNFDFELDESLYSSVKSFHMLREEASDLEYKETKNISSNFRGSRSEARREREISQNNGRETEKHDKTILNLYESIKCLVGPLLSKMKWSSPEKNTLSEIIQVNSTTTQVIEETENPVELVPDFSAIQGHYEYTLKEISNIWNNAISLIGSVKDHTLKFVEENDGSLDKEQLTLEAEMLQLAIDFAISYSKLKTDFLIKSATKNFGVKTCEKTELENYMDSKMFSNLYNNDDLASMAKTVQDLKASVLKNEDFEME